MTYLIRIVPICCWEEEESVSLGEVVEKKTPSSKLSILQEEILDMSNSSIDNLGVIRGNIIENSITAGFPQKPDGCSNNADSGPGEITITDPGTGANIIRKCNIKAQISIKSIPDRMSFAAKRK